MIELRECTICNGAFETVRTMGRPQEICSAECRQESGRRRQMRWRQRMNATRQQVAALAQAA